MPAFGAGLTQVTARTIPLDEPGAMQPRNVKAERVTYKGRAALRVTDAGAAKSHSERSAARVETIVPGAAECHQESFRRAAEHAGVGTEPASE